MLVNDNVQRQLLQILATNSVQKPSPDAEQRSASISHLQLNPGQQVKAEIISTLSNHLYLARVAGELFKLEIPLVVQPGQSVPLNVVAVKPRVVFEMQRKQEGGEEVSLSFLGRRLATTDTPVAAIEGHERAEAEVPAQGVLQGGHFLPGAVEEEIGDAFVHLPTVDEERRSAEKLQLSPGQQVKGEVVQTLPGKAYLVAVQGERFLMELPGELQKGEQVALSFVGSDPHVHFALQRGDGPPEPVRLSTIGKWLAAAPGEEGAPFPVQGALVHHAAEASTLLAARLREALTQGGLFYESHLAKWAAGALSLQEILKEPQGKLSRLRRDGDDSGRRDPGSAGNGIGDDRTLPLVREQLLLLNSRTLSFKGEPWPGQEMELTVREGGPDEEPGVEAALSLDLPRLGPVRARLHLGEQGVTLEVVTRHSESCEELKLGGGELLAASSAAGVRLARVSVRHEAEGE